MNTEYIRKQLKQAMDLIGNIDLNNYSNTTWKQRKLNEAFSILFDLDNLLKMEEKQLQH